MAHTPSTVTVSFETEIVCGRCGLAIRPDVVLELEKLVVPFIASVEAALESFKEEFMTASSDLHDLVGKLNDALTAITTELTNITAQIAADEANAIAAPDLSGLRDAVDRATALGAQAVSTSSAAQVADAPTAPPAETPPASASTDTSTPAAAPDTSASTGSASTDTSGTPTA